VKVWLSYIKCVSGDAGADEGYQDPTILLILGSWYAQNSTSLIEVEFWHLRPPEVAVK